MWSAEQQKFQSYKQFGLLSKGWQLCIIYDSSQGKCSQQQLDKGASCIYPCSCSNVVVWLILDCSLEYSVGTTRLSELYKRIYESLHRHKKQIFSKVYSAKKYNSKPWHTPFNCQSNFINMHGDMNNNGKSTQRKIFATTFRRNIEIISYYVIIIIFYSA